MTFEEARALFPVLERFAYLNAGTLGPLSRPTLAAVEERLQFDQEQGRALVFGLGHEERGESGLSKSNVEALAHGLPIVGCDIAAVREVTGGAAILVPPGRVAPLAAALRKLVTEKRSRVALAARSLRRARQLPLWAEREARFVKTVRSYFR